MSLKFIKKNLLIITHHVSLKQIILDLYLTNPFNSLPMMFICAVPNGLMNYSRSLNPNKGKAALEVEINA